MLERQGVTVETSALEYPVTDENGVTLPEGYRVRFDGDGGTFGYRVFRYDGARSWIAAPEFMTEAEAHCVAERLAMRAGRSLIN